MEEWVRKLRRWAEEADEIIEEAPLELLPLLDTLLLMIHKKVSKRLGVAEKN